VGAASPPLATAAVRPHVPPSRPASCATRSCAASLAARSARDKERPRARAHWCAAVWTWPEMAARLAGGSHGSGPAPRARPPRAPQRRAIRVRARSPARRRRLAGRGSRRPPERRPAVSRAAVRHSGHTRPPRASKTVAAASILLPIVLCRLAAAEEGWGARGRRLANCCLRPLPSGTHRKRAAGDGRWSMPARPGNQKAAKKYPRRWWRRQSWPRGCAGAGQRLRAGAPARGLQAPIARALKAPRTRRSARPRS
jgi:hypothetical protein